MPNLFVPAEAASRSKWQRRQQRATLRTGAQVIATFVGAAGLTWAAGRFLPGGLPIALGAIGLLLVGAFLGRKQLADRAHAEGLLLATLLGVAVAMVPEFARMQPAATVASQDPNNLAVARVMQVQRELQTAAGRTLKPGEAPLPATHDFVAFMKAQPGDDALLENPWGGPPQAIAVPVPATGPLRTAAQLAKGAPAVAMRTVVGPGQRPGAGRYAATTYGALVYDRDPGSGTYVLYAIGQEGDAAVVIHQATGKR